MASKPINIRWIRTGSQPYYNRSSPPPIYDIIQGESFSNKSFIGIQGTKEIRQWTIKWCTIVHTQLWYTELPLLKITISDESFGHST